ncbi:hypothetical protein [Lysinibacillus pakistanensis]|uniref:Uncharacterized protein n=1 Tax=Lysinibacillus pakistanensis TaxID=759811 RepID=A0AAX3WWZ2_9BACI|nr:hypothetical protein [Lysinibacillus pakistanensis]MDM5230277.1 hypothetical protein [Lysinibacillus pakistanensis]WHY45863.1 hypothetical protein QNH22_21725 [Lysinibacillus pakistanensis]WHY50875.1 hypothetical protein QNH24_21690 [Lysinibacillus pakistanensis]
MKEVHFNEWVLNIESEKTEAFIESNQGDCECLSCKNFRKANLLLDAEVMHFSNCLGLDLQKPTLLNAFPVDGEQVMYSGHYTVCGEVIEGEMDAWDVVVGNHCFSLVEDDDQVSIAEPHFQIGFEVVLQWLLPESLELIKK